VAKVAVANMKRGKSYSAQKNDILLKIVDKVAANKKTTLIFHQPNKIEILDFLKFFQIIPKTLRNCWA